MDKGIVILLLTVSIQYVYCQKCPAYWTTYASSSKCYRPMYQHLLSWQDARDMCRLHGGDLLKLETVPERTWVFSQIAYLKNHSKIPTTKWWVGLNNREYLTIWEWADGSSIAPNVINWHPGEPNNHGGNERCGEINNNEFNDQECTDVNRYICSRYRSVPQKCDTDNSWQPVNGQCFKVFTAKTSWYNAKRSCERSGGSMVTIKTQDDETVVHDFALNLKQELWIGLFSVQQPGNNVQWQWTDHTLLYTNYWHGNPHVDRSHLNTSCVVMSSHVAQLQAWTVQPCAQRRAYVCRKPEGVCFPGWLGHSSYCYQFNVQYRMSFDGATSYCKNQGAELLRYRSDTGTQFINSYLQEMRDSGVGAFWIGATDNNSDAGPYKWRNGQAVTYKNWATSSPANTKGKQDCVYVSTNDRLGRWRTTSNCRISRAFVCLIPMGATVTPATVTPRQHYGCPTNWRQNSGMCYRIFDDASDWVTSRSKCQQTPGADLASIRSKTALDFVNHNAAAGIIYWIGLNDRAQEGVYVWNDEQYPTTYTSWQPHQPNNYGETQNCVAQKDGQWGDFPCSQKKRYICSKSANSVGIMPAPTQATDWTVKCGPGWESNPLTSKCYMFVDQPLVWVNAYDMCKSNHGDLVAIETLEEQNYIAGRLQAMNSIGVWIGLNDRSTEQGWRWSSHRPFAFLNWAAGQPSSSGQGTDCVVMFTNTGQWDDVNCIQRNGYICEKAGNVPTTKPPATTTKKIPAGMVLGCRNGWKPYGTNCYLFRRMRSGINWMDSRTMCGRYRAQLASIQNKNEQDFVMANLWKNPKKSWDGIWIGLNDRQKESRFQWSDGTGVQYTQWNVGEPNSWQNHDEDCVLVFLNNSNWNDERCESKMSGYICKAPKTPMSSTQGPFQLGCPKYSSGYNALCYRLMTGAPKTWSDANAYCNRTFHGTLATVNDRFIQGFLSSQLLYRTGLYWLGLSDTAKPGTYVWASGDQVRYTDWDKSHIEANTNSCVGMNADQPIGLWQDVVCTLKHNFICQFPRTAGFSTEPTTPTPYPNVPCPTGWTARRDKCLKAYLGKTNLLTWMDARRFCQNLGGDLPSFHGATNDSFLATFITQEHVNLWIGLNDRDTEAGYKWSDGSAVDYTNWYVGEPNNYKGNEDCVVYWVDEKGWNDNSCYETMNYMCAIPRGATLPETTVIPPPSRSTQCGSDRNWYFFQQNCYMLPPASGDKAQLDWYDANDYCNGLGAHLASIHSVDEQFFLAGLIEPTSIVGYWIGLNELGLNGYSWTDKTPVDYEEWIPGEPNNYFGAERCVDIWYKNGRWNDNNCGRPRGYVCKKPVSGQVIIPSATPYPSGGCANGFTRVPGGRNKCFYLNSNKLNWTAARDHCQEFGKGYDIASIEDLFEQDFFMSIAKGHKDSQFWIGMSDLASEQKFIWQDNSPVTFTHWGPREPTSSNPNAKLKQDCVSIRNWKNHEGEWTDLRCTSLHSSVCQAKQDPNLPITPSSGGCNSGYMAWQHGCYKINTDVKSWSDAKTTCQNDGGALTSINDVYESGFVYTLASSKGAYWIGLSDERIPGLYGWVDSWPVTYTNWGYRQPSYEGGCVKVGPNTDRWNDTRCDEQLHYVCKITSAKPPTTNPTPPGNCSDPTWIPNEGFCYMAQVNARNTWPEANFQCQKSGMELVSVHSKQEMDFIFTLVGQTTVKDPKYKPNIWLGLSKGSQGSYTWSDNSAVNFLYWNPGEPSQLGIHNEIEECIEFNRVGEKWNDISCFSQRGYVCKTVKGISSLQQYILQQSGSGSGSDNSSGLSSGAIAGIVLGCVVVIVAILLVIIVLNCKGAVKMPKFSGNAGFDNKLYNIQNNGNRLDSDA